MKIFNENAACRGAWRRIFARSPIVREVIAAGKRKVPRYNQDGSRAKVDRVEIHCQGCNQWKPATVGFAVDHIQPVVGPEGFIDWNTFHKRLWCDKSNLQRLCKTCHDEKTNKERFERTLSQELSRLDFIEMCLTSDSGGINTLDVKFLKKFTKKRLQRYPKDFINKVNYLRGLINA
jgi:hypothetical protein